MITNAGDIGKISATMRKTRKDHEINAINPGDLARNFAAKAAVIREPRLRDIIAIGKIRGVSNSRVVIIGSRTISAPKRIEV
jgi:hypothetical protein